MANTIYTPTTWTDESPNTSPVKYRMIDDTHGHVADSATIEPVTTITPGTPLNALNLNKLEQGLLATSKESKRPIAMPGANKTIASGAITLTPINGEGHYKVDTESAAAIDQLDTISGGSDGDIVYLLQNNEARFVLLTEAGNISLPFSNVTTICLSTKTPIGFRYDASVSKWFLLSYDNATSGLWINNCATTFIPGMVVVYDMSVSMGLKVSTLYGDVSVAGICTTNAAQNHYVRIEKHKMLKVLVQGNVVKGHRLIVSTTAGRACDSGGIQRGLGDIGIAMEDYSGGGASSVICDVEIQPYSSSNALQKLASEVNYVAPAAATTHTFSVVVDAGTDCAVLELSSSIQNGATSVKLNNVGMTKLVSQTYSTYNTSEIWYIRTLDNGIMPGTYNVVVTIASAFIVAKYKNYIGTKSTPFRTPVSASGSNTSATLTPISQVGDKVIDVLTLNANSGWGVGAGQTLELSSDNYTPGRSTDMSVKDGAVGTTTMTWSGTSSGYSYCAVALAGS